jgi:hypothetical protein
MAGEFEKDVNRFEVPSEMLSRISLEGNFIRHIPPYLPIDDAIPRNWEIHHKCENIRKSNTFASLEVKTISRYLATINSLPIYL